MLDMLHEIVRFISFVFFDLGHPLPCWDIVAESLAVCR